VLIGCAVIFCASFGVWEFMRFQEAGGMAKLVLAIVFAIFAIALLWYLRNLDRFLKVGNRSK
jgi:hypothetical protein